MVPRSDSYSAADSDAEADPFAYINAIPVTDSDREPDVDAKPERNTYYVPQPHPSAPYALCNPDADAFADTNILADFDAQPIPDAIAHAFANAEPQCYGDAYLDPYPKRDTGSYLDAEPDA